MICFIVCTRNCEILSSAWWRELLQCKSINAHIAPSITHLRDCCGTTCVTTWTTTSAPFVTWPAQLHHPLVCTFATDIWTASHSNAAFVNTREYMCLLYTEKQSKLVHTLFLTCMFNVPGSDIKSQSVGTCIWHWTTSTSRSSLIVFINPSAMQCYMV